MELVRIVPRQKRAGQSLNQRELHPGPGEPTILWDGSEWRLRAPIPAVHGAAIERQGSTDTVEKLGRPVAGSNI